MIAQRPKSSYPFPQIDREQAQRQMKYFNHAPGAGNLRGF